MKKKIGEDTIEILRERYARDYINDVVKPEVSVLDRAIMLKEFLDNQKMTMASLSKKFDIPKTTIHEWLEPLKLSPEQKKVVRAREKRGEKVIMADINEMQGKDRLRKRKNVEPSISTSEKNVEFDRMLVLSLNRFEEYIGNVGYDTATRDNLIKLKNIISDIIDNMR